MAVEEGSTSKDVLQSTTENFSKGNSVVCDLESKAEIPQRFHTIIELLRFHRRCGAPHYLDMLAMSLDVQSGLQLLKEMASIIDRLTPIVVKKGEREIQYCYQDTVADEREAERFRMLGAEVEPRKEEGRVVWVVKVRCPPRRLSKDQLALLAKCVEERKITFYDLVLFALAD